MIRNERQYHTTMRKRQMLAEALEELSRSSGLPSVSWDTPDQVDREAFIVELQQASLVGQLADLDAELQEYRQLQTGEILASRVTSLDDLPDALVRARIAAGLSQRDLAARLGMKEQQVQRYEADRYASASLTRLRTVMEALDVQLEGDIRLPATETPSNQLRRRLLEWGFDRRVIDRRLLRDLGGDAGQTKVLAAIERVARLLMVPMQQLLAPTTDVPSLATTARFQAPRNAATGRLDAYTRYAEGLADIVLRATAHLPPPRLPGDARAVRSAMDHIAASMASAARGTHKDSETLLHAALRYTADLGVPVIALSDPGAFHGACFTRDGRSVIVLKHASDSPARWLAVLLHELDHLSDPNRNEPRTWIEL
ncbi:MAG: helix-turn-helix transcriptional regulator, partial [Nonomuraea sp.]|nr:helix-turn-helix transcriptional regulator [Nonomuraea sp.]